VLISLGAIAPEWRAVGVITLAVVLTVGLERLMHPLILRIRLSEDLLSSKPAPIDPDRTSA